MSHKIMTLSFESSCPTCGHSKQIIIEATEEQLEALLIIEKYHDLLNEAIMPTLKETGILEVRSFESDPLESNGVTTYYQIQPTGGIEAIR